MTNATLARFSTPTRIAAGPDAATSESRIDSDSHFNGLYETKQNLRIEGMAEGEIQCQGTLTVAEGARVKAKVTASTITIAGELEGEVTCQGVFQILPSGQVEAVVSARRLIVQEGGFYNGEFHMIADQPAVAEVNRATADRGAPKEPAMKAAAAEPASPDSLLSTDEWWAKMAGTQPPDGDAKKDDLKPNAP